MKSLAELPQHVKHAMTGYAIRALVFHEAGNQQEFANTLLCMASVLLAQEPKVGDMLRLLAAGDYDAADKMMDAP